MATQVAEGPVPWGQVAALAAAERAHPEGRRVCGLLVAQSLGFSYTVRVGLTSAPSQGSLDCCLPRGHRCLSQRPLWPRELWAAVHPSGGAALEDLGKAVAGGHGMLRPLPTLRAVPHCSWPAAPL